MIPREAVPLKDFERMERGLPPKAQPKRKVEEPKPPKVPDEITFANIPSESKIYDFTARSRTEKNKEGVRFTGYAIYIEFTDDKTLEGWIPEREFQLLKQRLQGEKPELLRKIGL